MSDNDGRSLERPLTPTDIAILRQQLEELKRGDLAIAQAEKAGLDMTEQKIQSKASKEKITKLLAVYG